MAFLTSFLGIFSADPMLRLAQMGLLFMGCLLVFLLLFAARDIILRTHSFLYQIVCIILVALLPGIGFLLYLLVRPARTIKERAMEAMLRKLTGGDHDEDMQATDERERDDPTPLRELRGVEEDDEPGTILP